MPIDREAVNQFLEQFENTIIPRIRIDTFTNPDSLIRQYRSTLNSWNNKNCNINDLYSRINEIYLADAILSNDNIDSLNYEPSISGTSQTIDFLANTPPDCPNIYIDAKTIRPANGNDWDRYLSWRQNFTSRTDLILDQNWMGGEIAHHLFTARQRFLQHTLSLEEKIEASGARGNHQYAMVFCGDGFRWHEDNLEDFADFYRTGRHRLDDTLGNIEAFYLEERGISLRRSVNFFCYLERPLASIEIRKFRWNVSGPSLYS